MPAWSREAHLPRTRKNSEQNRKAKKSEKRKAQPKDSRRKISVTGRNGCSMILAMTVGKFDYSSPEEEQTPHLSGSPLEIGNRKARCTECTSLETNMAVYLRRSVSGSRGALSSAICHRKPEREAPSVRLLAKQSPCRMHSSTTAIHRQTPSGDSKCSNETASQVAQSSAASPPDVRSQIKELEESLFKILCGPKPSNPLLVAIVRGLVKLAEQPSLEVIRAVASQFAETRDTHSSTVSFGRGIIPCFITPSIV